ncbi:unnamed protein product, partial [Meganyctiphanes norvegica]
DQPVPTSIPVPSLRHSTGYTRRGHISAIYNRRHFGVTYNKWLYLRPSTSHSESYRSRCSSLSRYPSPARSNHGSSSRASTPLASYGTLSLRTLLQETTNSPYSSRRSSFSSTSTTSGSSRRSSFSRDSPAPTQKGVNFKEERKETDITTSLMRDRGTFGLETNCAFNRVREGSLPRPSFKDTINSRTFGLQSTHTPNRVRESSSLMPSPVDTSSARMKMSTKKTFHVPSTSDDACRRRQARAAYLSALDDTGITIKNRDIV